MSGNPADLRGALEIDQNIYLERNTSTNTKISMLKKFFKAYGKNPEELVFYLRDQADDRKIVEEGSTAALRLKYWAFALDYIKKAHGSEGSYRNVNPTKGYWISGWFGISGFSIDCSAKLNQASVTLSLGKPDRDKNKSAFDYLLARKDEIERSLGNPVQWSRFEGKASYIHYSLNLGLSDEANWTQMAKFHAEWSRKFYDVFVPLLQQWNAMR